MEISLEHTSQGHQAAIYSLAPGLEGTFYTGDGNGWLVQWSIDQRDKGVLLAKTGDRIFALLQQGSNLWAGTMAGHLIVMDLQTKSFRKIDAHKKGIFGIYSWQDELITIGGDGQLKYWTAQAELNYSLPLSTQSLRALKIHPTQPYAAIGASDASIYWVALNERRILRSVAANPPSVFSLSWLNDDLLVSGGRDARLLFWTNQGETAFSQDVAAHLYTINAIAEHPSEDFFATAARDRTIKIWDKSTFALLKVIDAVKYGTPNGSVNRLLWFDDLLISVGDDRKVNWWKIKLAQGEAMTDDADLTITN